MKKVVLRFAEYNADAECYSVTAELWQCNKRTGDQYQMKLSGKLPSVENVLACYREWQDFYAAILQILRHSYCKNSTEINQNTETTLKNNNLSWFLLRGEIEIAEGGMRNVCIEEFEELCDRLKETINAWLNDPVFSHAIGQLYARLLTDEEILVAIETDDEKLWRLPWHLWNFFDTFHRAEVILSNLKYIRLETQKQHFNPLVNVLVILGDSTGIDLSQDGKLWLRLFWHWAYLRFLKQPKRYKEITDELKIQRGFDILFFAGHSQSKANSTTGTLYINEQESNNSVTIDRLENSFRTAVRNGLQLAIFNSCDGIGLARRLLEFNMPRIVVMRENVPNLVAQEFLKYFLQEFSSGKSLPVALRKAREQLEGIEDEFPCASWLPVLCQNSATPPLTWKTMRGKRPSFLRISAIAQMLFSFLLGFLIAIIFNWVFFPSVPATKYAHLASNRISLGEEILIKNNSSPEKKEGVSAFEDGNYGVAMSKFDNSLRSKSNDPETLIYLNNAEVALLGGNPIKIAVSIPIGSNQEVAEEILRGVALAQQEINDNSRINGKLQVVIADDENDGKIAQKIATLFVKDASILAVVGHNASNASQEAMPIYKSGELVAITPTSFADNIQGNAYIFKMVPQITLFAAKLSHYVLTKITNPNVAICFDPDAPDNQYFRQRFEQILQPSGGRFIAIPCPFKDSSFNPNIVVDAIKSNNANSLLVSTHVDRIPQAIEVFKTVRDNNLKINLFGSPTFYSNQTIKLGKEAVEKLSLSVPYYPSKNNEFSRKSEQGWHTKTDTWRTPMAYDATQAIVVGLEKVLQQKQAPIRQQLDKVLRQPNFSFQGVTGTIKFDPNTGERDFSANLNQSDAIIQIKNGDFVKIK
ncbi:MAG: ABC transporter substrate-binding protein [Hydrococcus sp. Prado102]|jgi:branched-chain amino acid transport system substrate-binding protein|nr:ABC transporter substrate-binding protein [Hydrococcus sp. Prado102]